MIDAHTHLFGSEIHPDLLAEGEQLGIDLFVCSSLGTYPIPHFPTMEESEQANDAMLANIRRYPDKLAAYCYSNPRHGRKGVEQFRRRMEDHNFIGLKLLYSDYCNDPGVFPFVEQAVLYQAPILIHCFRSRLTQLPYETCAWHVADLAERYPEARIIMAHLGGQVESAMNTIAPYPNVSVDTSGTPIGGNAVSIAVQRLGAERVVFGSDLPRVDLASNIGKILGAGLSDAENRLIFHDNMTRLLSGVKA